MHIRFRQYKKWIDILNAKYYAYGLKRYLYHSKQLQYKKLINRLYGFVVKAD